MKKNDLSKWRIGRNGRLILLDGEMDQVVSLTQEEDGTITFREECDNYFFVTMPKEEAKKALIEALAWLDEERP
jgi:hypothetical protein